MSTHAQVNLTPYDIPALMRGESQPPRLHVTGTAELTAIGGSRRRIWTRTAEGAFEGLEKALRKMTRNR